MDVSEKKLRRKTLA